MSNTGFGVFGIAASAMTAQSQRMNLTASNLANADSVTGPDGKPYRARQVVFEAQAEAAGGVRVARVVESTAAMRQVHEPGNPLADAQGYVSLPNVNPVEEMVNMISASRSYQNNIEVMSTAKSLLLKTLQLGQS